MTTQSPPFDIEDVKRIHLLPGDVLLVKLKSNASPSVVAEFANRTRTELAAVFKDNDIVVHDSAIDFMVVKPDPPTESIVTKWQKYPDITPAESGYYMAYYFNQDNKENYYKAIYWDNIDKRWIPWRNNQSPDLSQVHGFLASTFDPFYVPCVTGYNANPMAFDIPLG